MADGGAQAGAYQVLAWDGTGVQVGTLEAGQLRLAPVGRELRLADIRNCSAAPGGRWAGRTRPARQTGAGPPTGRATPSWSATMALRESRSGPGAGSGRATSAAP